MTDIMLYLGALFLLHLFLFSTSENTEMLSPDVRIHSEYLSLKYDISLANSSSIGVFAKHNIPPKTVLCELSGFLHEELALSFSKEVENTTNLFLVRTPYGQKFYIAENTVCSKFVACAGSQYAGGLLYDNVTQVLECNAEMVGSSSGKIFVRSTHPIDSASEIYVRYFGKVSDEARLELFVENAESIFDNELLHSDELFLFKAPSLIPFLKKKMTGVFAKHFIPQYGSVCVSRGHAFPLFDAYVSDRYSPPIRIADSFWKLEMENICGYVNDIVDINRVYTKDDVRYMYDLNESLFTIPTFPGFAYNVVNVLEPSTLIPIMVATVDIQPGAELFMAYGK